ncbi:hypothetical protein ACIO1C_32725 [Streptomyces sp. NPDC087420]|uniref:hypothetical protein n=1 Tax=Streptomyces sp. NPDC087420 TaxID=3365785 RepID=UPI0038380426
MTGRAGAGPAGPEGAVRVSRFTGPRGTTLHLAFATGDPAQPLPANGGLRVQAGGPPVPDPRRLTRRLATEMLLKHRLHHTGFWGAKMLVTGADAVDDNLLAAVARVLNTHAGTLYTGADMGVSTADMERLSRMTPYVLNAIGSSVEPHTATAFGVLGAVEAWTRGPVTGLRVLVHGVGKVGGVLAGELVAAGATVLTYDTDPRVPDIPGSRSVRDWAEQDVDVLVPCSVSDLVDPALAGRLRCGAVIGSANAVLAEEDTTAAILRRRGVDYVPTPLVGAGAVIVDSIEHYARTAFRAASPDRVYAFVRQTVRTAVRDLLDTAPGPAPSTVLRHARDLTARPFCGLRFPTTGAEGDLQGHLA